MKKRLLSLFLAWAMCLTMLPAMALADEEPESEPVAQSGDDTEPVMDETEFRNAVAKGGEVTLTGNVTLTSEGMQDPAFSRVTVQKDVQLDLKGYTITANFNDYVFVVSEPDKDSTNAPTLTLNDSVGGGKITHGTYLDGSGTEKTYISSGIHVYKGNFIMNGGTITGNVTNGTDGAGVDISSSSGNIVASTFTMTGGAITGNLGARTGGVSLFTNGGVQETQCTFTMTGGTISGNQATGESHASVGGVYLNSSVFTMTGGSITGNNSTVTDTSNFSTTGGVLAITSALQPAVTVGGTAQIYDNWISGEKSGDSYVKGDNGTAGNVLLGTYGSSNSKTDVTLSISAKTPLTSDAKIGVTTNTEPTSDATAPFATGAQAADKAYFSSDKGNGIIYNSDSGQLEMQAVAHSHDDGEGFMHTLTSNDSSQLVIDDEVQEATQGPSQYAPDYYYLPSGNYYLAGDLKLDHTLFINDHAEVSICLNGHNIIANVPERETVYSFDTIYVTNYSALTVTDCHDIDHAGKITHIRDTAYHSGGGVNVSSHSTFTLHNGIISGNNAINIQKNGCGGGVSVFGTSTFNMTGGSITGNTANGGGGVDLHSSTFNMTGGSITGNTAVGGVYYGSTYKISYYGGGVLLEEPSQYIDSSTMTVSGSVKITDNKNDAGIENNVLGGPITIGNSGLNSDAEIGISLFSTLGTNDYEIIAANVPNEAYKDYLTQDTTEYTFVYHDKTLMLVNGKVHIHTICGVADCTEHGGELLFENKLTASNSTLYINGKTVTSTSGSNFYSLPAGHYYLDTDITLNKLLSVGGDVTICLNGHKIISNYAQALNIEEYWGQNRTLTLTDCQNSGQITSTDTVHSSGVCIGTNCTFNMYGGTITGNAIGVSVYSSGFFNMYGGTITGNSRTSGNGVGVEITGGTFTMYGGNITGNTIEQATYYDTTSCGAGVYVNSNGEMHICGKVNITGNTVNDVENNVYLVSGNTITVDGKLDAASRIGVSTDLSRKPAFVDIATATDASYVSSGNFLSDDSDYHVGIDGTTVKLMAHAHKWAYTASGATITAQCVSEENCPDRSGGSVTVSAPAHTVYRDGKDANAAVTPGSNWSAAAANTISVTYDGGSTTAPTDAGQHTASISLTGVDGQTATATVNYTIEQADLTANDFTFNAPNANDLIYNGSAKAVSVTSDNVTDSDITVHYFQNGEEVSPIDAGTYTVKIDVRGCTNFKDVRGLTANSWKFTITPADLTEGNDKSMNIRYTDTKEKTYPASDFGFTVGGTLALNSPVTSDILADGYPKISNNDTLLVKLKDNLTLNVPAQTVTIPLTFTASSGNYNPKTVNLTITLSDKDTQAALNITSPNAVTYGDKLTLTAEGGSTDSAVEWSITDGTGKAHIDENGVLIPDKAGTVTVTATKPGNAQYSNIVATQTITIKQATITITAKNQTAKVGDAAAPDLTGQYEVTGLAKGEALKTQPTIAYAETPDLTKTGTVAITVSGAEAPDGGNYNEIVYKNGTLTISARPSSGGGGSSSTPKHTVSVPSGTTGGAVKSNISTAASGSTVTITITPEDGYKLDSLTVTDSKGNTLKLTDKGSGKFTFTMPNGKVDVKPVFVKKAAADPADDLFRDVSASDYFYEPVKWAKANGITDGVSDTEFAPHDGCTRAHTVTFLWRAAGSPEPQTAATFSDVAAGSYYAKAVAWAIENGITNGTSATTFSPDAVCTRAHCVAFLYRAAKAAAPAGDLVFQDVAADAYYATAVKWATEHDITNGISSTQFGPDASCTRAQIVTFLYRLMND